MSEYSLEIITPERVFYSGMVESLVVDTAEGQRGVWASHTPMVMALSEGAIRISEKGKWRICACSKGFLEVRPDSVIIIAQTVEWPGEIDIRRARESAARAQERLRQRQALREYLSTQASLARALARLSVADKNDVGFM